MTPDGRYVAFYSTATNLVPGVTNAGDVYVRDLVAGTTYWASTNAQASPAVSQGVILRYNLQTGLTEVASTNAVTALSGFEADAQILNMTPDGRFTAFVANWDSTSTCIYQWDALAGTNVLVSGNFSNLVSTGTVSDYLAQNSNGRFVAFFCSDSNMTSEAQANGTLYLRDLQTSSTVLVDRDAGGLGAGADASATPGLSDDGNFIAFQSFDRNLVSDDRTRDRDVFVRNLIINTNELISVHTPSLPSLTPNGPSMLFSSSVSTNGRYIAFASDANNLVANDTNECRDVFVRDLLLETNILASVGTNGFAASNISTEPSITGDGRLVVFSSYATNMVTNNETTNTWNVFLRDLQAGTTEVVSLGTNGGFGNGDSYSPTISRDGRYVLFHSKAQNLAPGSFAVGIESLFLRDRESGTTYALTVGSSGSIVPLATMTPDGNFVAYAGTVAGAGAALFVWNSQTASWIYTHSATAVSAISISPDGERLAYLAGSPLSLSVADLSVNSNWLVSAGIFLSQPGLQFSADGQFLAYATSAAKDANDSNGTQDVYVYDFQSGTNRLISRSFNSSATPNDASDSPVISPDGRYVAYRSFASNIVPMDFNQVPDLFLNDCSNNTSILLSVSENGDTTANNRSAIPVFSGDGKMLIFQSAASDLSNEDFNHSSDIFAFNFIPPGTTDITNAASTFNAQIAYGVTPDQESATPAGPLITWPALPGISYRIQFKDDLSDPIWQDFDGNVILTGENGSAYDLSPAAPQRFYRFILTN